MALLKRLAFAAVPLLLLLLTAIAGYAYSKIRYLSLPISQALALFAVVLPLMTGVSTQIVTGLIQRSSRQEQNQLTLPLVAVIGFQLIYETVVATLALTYILPPSALRCGLETKWQKLYLDKDIDAIRSVQDAFNCCGLFSVVDRAFPLGHPSSCATTFGRNQSCFAAWRKAEQTNAGLLLLVAIIVFILKVLSIVALLTNASWTRSRWVLSFKQITRENPEESDEDTRATMRRLIEEGVGEEGYHDEPNNGPAGRVIEAQSEDDNHGARVEPSSLIDTGNEWRNEGENRGN